MRLCDVQGDRHDVRDDSATYESDTAAAEMMSNYERVLRLGTTKSRLFVDCVRPSDAGVYTCVAETPTLRISTTIQLRVGETVHRLLSSSPNANAD